MASSLKRPLALAAPAQSDDDDVDDAEGTIGPAIPQALSSKRARPAIGRGGDEAGVSGKGAASEAAPSSSSSSTTSHASSSSASSLAAPVPAPPHRADYLAQLPSAELYERSYMHRELVTHAVWTPRTEYLVTASNEGVLKWWKKTAAGIEFVKLFRAHLGAVAALCASADGMRLASVGDDRSVKYFDVVGFDLAALASLPFAPSAACWCHAGGLGAARPWLAVAERFSLAIHLFNADRADAPAEHTVRLHGAPVLCMAYNAAHDAVISADARGIIEVWSARPEAAFLPRPGAVEFLSKLDTDLLDLARARALPTALSVSPDGSSFAVAATDGRLRLFGFASGRVRHSFGVGLAVPAPAERESERGLATGIDEMDMSRRRSVEAELRDATLASLRAFVTLAPAAPAGTAAGPLPPHADAAARESELKASYRPPPSNAVFDETSTLIAFPSIFGVLVAEVASGEVVAALGRLESSERFLGLALYQGVPAVSSQMALARGLVSSSEPMSSAGGAAKSRADPTLVCCAYKRQRFFLFSRREPAEGDRDVQNEPPSAREVAVAEASIKEAKRAKLGRGAILHTTLGDITVQLYGDACPLAVENFSELARRGYYDGTVFHRVIKDFMVQGGDPLGDGTGGDSIFGADFKDELAAGRRFDREGLLAMANGGPNTNGSQFFLTVAPCQWLDGKHTIFGQVVRGLESLKAIAAVKVDKHDKPWQPVKVLSITVT